MYCTGTESCTPNTEYTGTSTTITLNESNSTQYVCAKTIDYADNASDPVCSSEIIVDKTEELFERIINKITNK